MTKPPDTFSEAYIVKILDYPTLTQSFLAENIQILKDPKESDFSCRITSIAIPIIALATSAYYLGTAVLGGVFKTTDTSGKVGIPGLMNIPIIGWLFKGSNRATNRQELLIFITPYIISDARSALTNPTSEANLEP